MKTIKRIGGETIKRAIVIGGSYWFGVMQGKPELPAGWTWIERENYWLLVRSDKGQEYFVELRGEAMRFTPKKKATLWDAIRTRWKLKPGATFADDRPGRQRYGTTLK